MLALEQTARFGRQSLASPVGAHINAGDILLLDVHDASIDTEARFRELHLEPLPLSGTYFSGVRKRHRHGGNDGACELTPDRQDRETGATAGSGTNLR